MYRLPYVTLVYSTVDWSLKNMDQLYFGSTRTALIAQDISHV